MRTLSRRLCFRLLFVCLSVSLLAALRKNFWTDLHNISETVCNRPVNKWLNFGGYPNHGSGYCPDPYRDAGKTCLGAGRHSSNASNYCCYCCYHYCLIFHSLLIWLVCSCHFKTRNTTRSPGTLTFTQYLVPFWVFALFPRVQPFEVTQCSVLCDYGAL